MIPQKMRLDLCMGKRAYRSPYHIFSSDLYVGLDARIGASNDGTTFAWVDQSTHGANAIESTAGKLPTIVNDDDLPAINLAQSTGRAKITYAAPLSQPCTIWVVGKVPSVASSLTNAVFDGINAGNGQRSQFVAIGTPSASTWRLFAGAVLDSGTTTAIGAYHIFRLTYGVTDAITIDGSATPFLSGDAGSNVSNGMYLGAINDGTTLIEAGPLRYRAILVVGRATTAFENYRTEKYLSLIWGIPLVP